MRIFIYLLAFHMFFYSRLCRRMMGTATVEKIQSFDNLRFQVIKDGLCMSLPLTTQSLSLRGLTCLLLFTNKTSCVKLRFRSSSFIFAETCFPVERIASRFWVTRQSNGCSTPAPRSGAA